MRESTRKRYAHLLGKKIGRLTVVELVDDPKLSFRCLCECGNESFPTPNKLIDGDTFSCGCLRKEKMRQAFFARKGNKKISEMTIEDWK